MKNLPAHFQLKSLKDLKRLLLLQNNNFSKSEAQVKNFFILWKS